METNKQRLDWLCWLRCNGTYIHIYMRLSWPCNWFCRLRRLILIEQVWARLKSKTKCHHKYINKFVARKWICSAIWTRIYVHAYIMMAGWYDVYFFFYMIFFFIQSLNEWAVIWNIRRNTTILVFRYRNTGAKFDTISWIFTTVTSADDAVVACVTANNETPKNS